MFSPLLRNQNQMSCSGTVILLSAFLYLLKANHRSLQVAQHSREFTEPRIDRDLTSSTQSPHVVERSRSE